MEPISSLTTSRASSSQPPVPAQQKRDTEALTAPQPRTDTYSTSAPGQDVQLQRRQVVEDIGKNQKATNQLQGAGEQLQAAKSLADTASSSEVSEEQRESLGQQFNELRTSLNSLADDVERSGRSASSLRIETGIRSADEARKTSQTLDSSLNQLDGELAALAQQGQTLGSDFPRTAQKDNVEPPIRSSQEASQRVDQLQRQVRAQPQDAVTGQANIGRQTALTLFQ